MKNNSNKNSSHTGGNEKRFVNTEENRAAGSCRETVGRTTVFDRIFVEDLDLRNEGDLDRFFDMIFGEWSQMSGAGFGIYPLIGMITIDPENNMSSQVLVATAALSPGSGAEEDMQEEGSAEQSPGGAPEHPVEGGESGNAQEEPTDSSPSAEITPDSGREADDGDVIDREAVRQMLTDMDCLKGLLYAASQIILLGDIGAVTAKQRDDAFSQYCKNAEQIVMKWEDYRKSEY